MSSNGRRYHSFMRWLATVHFYRLYGPLIGPKETHQRDYRWERH